MRGGDRGLRGEEGKMNDTFPQAVEAEEELIQGRPTALHPCGARRVRSCPKYLQAFGVFRFPRGG